MKRVIFGILMIGIAVQISAQTQSSIAQERERFGQMPTSRGSVIDTAGMDARIVMSLAWASFEQGDLASALQYAERIRQELGQHSEAEYLIGLIYMKEGLPLLAERSLKNALLYAYTAEERADYGLALANLYYRMQDYPAMEQQLEDVIFGLPYDDEAIAFRQTLTGQMRQARQIMLKEGIDRVAELYRWQGLHHDIAVEMLALYAYNHDTYVGYGRAVELFTYSTILKVGVLVNQLMVYDPSYRFSTLEDLLVQAKRYPSMQIYIDNVDFYRTIFFLAASLYAYEKSDVSKILWNGLRLQSSTSPWIRRAALRFRQPMIEDFSAEFDGIFKAQF
ncbi:tetratricopeptide repeat protein [Entomospira culicis]|uniref:Tetratricopeptide repeat protein n=1 Tax=Entomospira culicis TaxID=2719989 RepID=A0A968GG50_9SPIO|nr:hypothetical protein [Entomospira culicis]NIZ19408.1 hypothetical protein [Entomospira culicis]NIZ69687.1 hypothetical protein [Entomospira culicis]WDI36797.1 hypothetical protein PVA46_05585 [Entomospira culicis]WDI38426.1 hypothetical protein PVA47_05595 [Entomospira culicis]